MCIFTTTRQPHDNIILCTKDVYNKRILFKIYNKNIGEDKQYSDELQNSGHFITHQQ